MIAVYCPSRHAPPSVTYATFFQSLSPRFLVGGDWNAKHTTWGAHLITPKGRTLLSVIHECHCTYYSTGEPTYRPNDHHRIPDLLDFFVARCVAANSIRVESVFELSSDHSPIIATFGTHLPRVIPPHSPRFILTGMHFVPIFLLTSTLTYGSNNVVSWAKRRTTSLPSSKTPLGTPHNPLENLQCRLMPPPPYPQSLYRQTQPVATIAKPG